MRFDPTINMSYPHTPARAAAAVRQNRARLGKIARDHGGNRSKFCARTSATLACAIGDCLWVEVCLVAGWRQLLSRDPVAAIAIPIRVLHLQLAHAQMNRALELGLAADIGGQRTLLDA